MLDFLKVFWLTKQGTCLKTAWCTWNSCAMWTLFILRSGWVGINFAGIWLWVSMPPRCKLSILDSGQALAWLNDGVSMREVVRRLQESYSVVQQLQERLHATGRGTGTPTPDTHTAPAARTIISCAFPQCTNEWCDVHHAENVVHLNVSTSTIAAVFTRQGFTQAQQSDFPWLRLTATHVQRCGHHLCWIRQQLSRILFTDESRFIVAFNNGRRRVWHRVRDERALHSRRCSGGPSL